MTTGVEEKQHATASDPADLPTAPDAEPVSAHVWRRESARRRFPARTVAAQWPATRLPLDEVQQRLLTAPFTLDMADGQGKRASGIVMLLDWLQDQPGDTWQARWHSSGIEVAGAEWRQEISRWLHARGMEKGWRLPAFASALAAAISADLVRPSTVWLVVGRATGQGLLVRALSRARDPEGFARLRDLGEADASIRPDYVKLSLHRAAMILAAKGGTIADITVGDVVELLNAQAAEHLKAATGSTSFYSLLRRFGALGPDAPESLRGIRNLGQRTPEELIDRYGLRCRPVRDLLVDYLRERQPALDYASLKALSYHLGKRFWQDIERHHPGSDSLRLAPEVIEAWKQRLRTKAKTVAGPDGRAREIRVERINYCDCLTPVRAFYLDIAQWALDDPAHWGPWVARSPVRDEEVNQRKSSRQRKARMDARTRERLPVLPVLVRAVDQHRKNAAAVLEAAREARPGQAFSAGTRTRRRPAWGGREDLGRGPRHRQTP